MKIEIELKETVNPHLMQDIIDHLKEWDVSRGVIVAYRTEEKVR